MATILIVDDDTTQRMMAGHFLNQSLGVTTVEAMSGQTAISRIADATLPPIDLVLLDLYMPGMDGKQVLRYLHERYPDLPVIMITASDAVEDAVALMRAGASDFLSKPYNPERLRLSVEQHLTIRSLRTEVERLKRHENDVQGFTDIIGAQTGLAGAVALARKASGSDIPVLISGESGTGKELLARAIHGESGRSSAPFIAINCGAIPENLVESTLFGHEKGAFTGAITREIGKFREAEGGTLFLDEVGELKPDIQTKLLRALQQREIEPVGAGKPVKVNVRIISATHRNLAQDVIDNLFRQDLYYRLNVLPVAIPPLRERRIDIPAITQHTLQRFCAQERKPLMRLTATGSEWLAARDWPGNVRELENLLYRAVVLLDKTELDGGDFITMTLGEPMRKSQNTGGPTLALTDNAGRMLNLEEIEARVIGWAINYCGGNIPKAATALGMGQSTLYKKLSSKVA